MQRWWTVRPVKKTLVTVTNRLYKQEESEGNVFYVQFIDERHGFEVSLLFPPKVQAAAQAHGLGFTKLKPEP
jgi:hypothetical protein